jgi:hypothetical protein
MRGPTCRLDHHPSRPLLKAATSEAAAAGAVAEREAAGQGVAENGRPVAAVQHEHRPDEWAWARTWSTCLAGRVVKTTMMMILSTLI